MSSGPGYELPACALGDEYLELTEYLAPQGRPAPSDARGNDGWFQHVAIIVSDMDRAYAPAARVQGAARVLGSANASRLEPRGRRNPRVLLPRSRWPLRSKCCSSRKGRAIRNGAASTNRLFLGIDHTAIVIQDTTASLRFYRDRLGLRVAGESENYGPEQERLNNVFGARLRITAVRGDDGPGIEFLEYLVPPRRPSLSTRCEVEPTSSIGRRALPVATPPHWPRSC